MNQDYAKKVPNQVVTDIGIEKLLDFIGEEGKEWEEVVEFTGMEENELANLLNKLVGKLDPYFKFEKKGQKISVKKGIRPWKEIRVGIQIYLKLMDIQSEKIIENPDKKWTLSKVIEDLIENGY